MHNIIIPFYSSWLYVISSYYDFKCNEELYNQNMLNKIDNLFWNIFIFLPLSLFLVLSTQPLEIFINEIYIELLHITLNIIFGEIWFYCFHRLLHNKYLYKFHKKHHELVKPIGIYALYAHPVDAIIVNMGSIYLLHYIFRFSIFQVYLVGSIATMNTIINSHSGRKYEFHQKHHEKFNCNFGLNLFMDRIFS